MTSGIPISGINTGFNGGGAMQEIYPTNYKVPTDPLEGLGVSDKIVQQVLQSVVPFQGDMSQIIQNRPQVMLPQPIRPHQAQMGEPVGNVQSTTAAGTQRNDLNNLISGVGNIVKAGVNKKREKEDRDLMYDLSIIQAASSNPNDPHNKALLDTIASDPKKVKRLQKALGFNPLSGEEMPPETKALMKGAQTLHQKKQEKAQQIQQAIAQQLGGGAAQMQGGGSQVGQQAQSGGAMSNLMNRMPNTPQMNPIVAIQGELIKAGILPKADTSLKAMTDLTKELMTNQEKFEETKMKVDASNNRTLQQYFKSVQDAKDKIELEKMKLQGAKEQEQMKQKGAKERTQIRAGATVGAAKIHADATKYTADKRSQTAVDRYKATHSEVESKKLDKAIKNIDADIKNLDVQIATARTSKDTKKIQQLTEEQEAKKALKTALEQKEIDSSPEVQGNGGTSNEDEILDELDRIF